MGRTGDRPGTRQLRPRYTLTERLAIMCEALTTGLRATARHHGIPPMTISRWFAELGGYETVRQYVYSRLILAQHDFDAQLYTTAKQRLARASDQQLFELIVRIRESQARARDGQQQPSVSVTVSQQQAQQQVMDDDERRARLIAHALRIAVQLGLPAGGGAEEAGASEAAGAQAS